MTNEQLTLVKNFVDGIKVFADETEKSYFDIDYIDELENALNQDEIDYTEEEKEEMLSYILSEIIAEYGEENVFYGSPEHLLVVDGHVQKIYAQMVILK